MHRSPLGWISLLHGHARSPTTTVKEHVCWPLSFTFQCKWDHVLLTRGSPLWAMSKVEPDSLGLCTGLDEAREIRSSEALRFPPHPFTSWLGLAHNSKHIELYTAHLSPYNASVFALFSLAILLVTFVRCRGVLFAFWMWGTSCSHVTMSLFSYILSRTYKKCAQFGNLSLK